MSGKVKDFKAADGDWTCPDPSCGNLNFARRHRCNRCEIEKPLGAAGGAGSGGGVEKGKKKLGIEIGKSAAEKSKGLFSAEDWQCSKCGNVNWARRSTCNVCNEPKFGDIEERTGLGGGFNEREDVRYKRHDSDEEEYDDFGRKKKKFRGKTSDGEKAPPPLPPSKPDKKAAEDRDNNDDEEDEDDEDDEEDEDDGDLGKYDLWGDDDGDDDKKADDAGKEKQPVADKTRDGRAKRSSRSRDRGRSPRSRSREDRGRSSRSRSRDRGRRGSRRSSSRSRSGSRNRKSSRHRGRGGGGRSRSYSSSRSRSRSRSRW